MDNPFNLGQNTVDPNTAVPGVVQPVQDTSQQPTPQPSQQGYPIQAPFGGEHPAFAPTTELPKSAEIPLKRDTVPVIEKQPITEIFRAPETEPIIKPMQPNLADPQPLAATQQPATPPIANIVDETKNIAPLHPVNTAVDKLTTIADQEEEEFIKEVEAAHEHQ